jgi:hypothetical protein
MRGGLTLLFAFNVEQEEWDVVLQRMRDQPGNLVSFPLRFCFNIKALKKHSHFIQVCVLRQMEPEKLEVDLAAALKQRIECLFMQRMKLPMAGTLVNSLLVWKRCMALQPPILWNKRQLGDIAVRVIALIDAVSTSNKKAEVAVHSTTQLPAPQLPSLSASSSSSAASPLPYSPIKFVITGRPGDGKTLSIAILSLFLQDHFKLSNMSSSIIIPVFPSFSCTFPHACDILKSINHQLRERLPNSFRRPEPPHSSLRNLKLDFVYYTETLLEISNEAIIAVIIDDLHLLSHSVACVDQLTYGYFLPFELNSRVITIVASDPSHVLWLQSQSLAPPPSCIIGLKDGAGCGDCRVGIISTFAAKHLERLTEAEGLVLQAMASNESRSEFIRDIQHFRSVFATAADEQARFHAIQERCTSSFGSNANIKMVMSGTPFLKWLGSDGDLPNKGSENAFFFSHSSMAYVRGCCAALESLSPPNDFRVVTIVKRMLDAGLADACLIGSVNFKSCLLAVLEAACRIVRVYIVARIVSLASCAPLSPHELVDILTLDGDAVGELDPGVSAYSIKQFPLRVVDDVLNYLGILGVVLMENDAGGVLVVPPHIKLSMLEWAATKGFTEHDAHSAIGQYWNVLLYF